MSEFKVAYLFPAIEVGEWEEPSKITSNGQPREAKRVVRSRCPLCNQDFSSLIKFPVLDIQEINVDTQGEMRSVQTIQEIAAMCGAVIDHYRSIHNLEV